MNNTQVIGYINALDLESQKIQAKQLTTYGVDRWVSEQINGKLNRTAFDQLIDTLRKGDCLVICTIYQLPLTALQCIEFLSTLKREAIEFECLEEKIDLNTVSLLYSLHKMTRRERSRGVLAETPRTGRPKGMLSQKNKEKGMAAAHLYKTEFLKGSMTIKELMVNCKIKSKSTLYIWLRANNIEPNDYKKKHKK